MSNEGAVLEIEYNLSADVYRRAWFHSLRESLLTTLAFWGTLILLGISAMYYFRNAGYEFVFFAIITALIVAFLIFSGALSYQQYMHHAKMEINSLGDRVRLIFKADSDGFEVIDGKNYRRISWDSITFYDEFEEYIILGYSNGMYIPKNAFQSADELSFFKSLVQVKSLARIGK